jgi:hypothetical protein
MPDFEFVVISIIPKPAWRLGQLATFDILSFRRQFSKDMERCRIPFAVGGIDFSFNEHKTQLFPSRWVPHFWILANRANRVRWEILLRKAYPANRWVLRPVKIETWDGKRRALGYALKTNFSRRISLTGTRHYRRGERTCKITTYDRLRVRERLELYQFLAKIGLGARIIVLGVDAQEWPTRIDREITQFPDETD